MMNNGNIKPPKRPKYIENLPNMNETQRFCKIRKEIIQKELKKKYNKEYNPLINFPNVWFLPSEDHIIKVEICEETLEKEFNILLKLEEKNSSLENEIKFPKLMSNKIYRSETISELGFYAVEKYDTSLLNYIYTIDTYKKTETLKTLPITIIKQLEIIHDLGYTHNDVNIRNILVKIKTKNNFKFSLCDFGSAVKNDKSDWTYDVIQILEQGLNCVNHNLPDHYKYFCNQIDFYKNPEALDYVGLLNTLLKCQRIICSCSPDIIDINPVLKKIMSFEKRNT